MIQVGDKLPEMTLTLADPEGTRQAPTSEIFGGKTVALFAVPGAFTPTCSAQHLPSFREHAAALKAKGVDAIACLSVNDVFVMGAWAKDQNVAGQILMIADGSAAFSEAMGLDWDLSGANLGKRSKRYSMLVKDGVVAQLNIEQPGEYRVSSAEYLLSHLG